MSAKNVVDLFGHSHPSKRSELVVEDDTALVAPPLERLNSSKEIFARLNPYFERILIDLVTSYSSFVVPSDMYSKLAEAYNVKNRGDPYTIDLLLTIGKLKSLLAKKIGVSWPQIEKDIIRPLMRKHRSDHYAAGLHTLETIPASQWFYGDEPITSAMDILLAARRMGCEIMYDEWADVCRIIYHGETFPSMKLDDIHYLLTKEFTYHFKFRIEKRHTMDAIGVLRRDPQYIFNSRLDYLDGFLPYYNPDFEWRRECVEILHCKIDAYHEEVARALFISPTERSYHPGCIQQHMIILDDPKGDMGKSTLPRILAGNPSLDGGTKWFTSKNIFSMKNDVTRYAETKGKAIHEYAELARMSQMDLEHLKNDITSTVESCRPHFSMDLQEKPRWFYTIGTTNKDQYNYDIINRRYYGIKVSIDGKMIDNVRLIDNFNKMMGSLVWSVKNGMSGAISKEVAAEARYQQDIRIVELDLMAILKQIIAMCHVYKGKFNTKADIELSPVDVITRRYQIGYKDECDLEDKLIKRAYYVSLTGLSNFATDYVNFYNRKEIRIGSDSIKVDMLKLMLNIDVPYDSDGKEIQNIDEYEKKDEIAYQQEHFKWKALDKVTWVPTLQRSIRGYSLEISAPHIAKVYALALSYVVDLQDFLIKNFKDFM